jgi:hypothetical protein
LAVAVACPIFGAGLVVGIPALAAITIHFREIEGTVEAAWEIAHVDIERELLILQVEEDIVLEQGP